MNRIDFELNPKGVRELLKSAEMQAIVKKSAEQICRAAQADNPDYEVVSKVGQTRVSATVRPTSIHAYNSNRAHNTLEKALRSGKV